MTHPDRPPSASLFVPAEILERLEARATRAGLFDQAGRADVVALRNRAIDALCTGGDTPGEAIHALVLDQHDPDMAVFVRASVAAAVAARPPRWIEALADGLDLDTGIRTRLRIRAEKHHNPGGQVPNLATMANSEFAVAFNGRQPTEAELVAWITAHPEPAMVALFRALEHARLAARPN